MKNFEKNWDRCARAARQAPRRDESAPFGFAARVAALRFRGGGASEDGAWDQLLSRWLAGALVVLVLCAAIEAPHFRDNRPLHPGVENTVAKLLWKL